MFTRRKTLSALGLLVFAPIVLDGKQEKKDEKLVTVTLIVDGMT